MADTTRKRSRKSKLVPRECPMDEDDVEMQLPATKIPKNMKQNTNKVKKSLETELTKPVPDPITSNPEPTASKSEEAHDTSILKKINDSARNSIETEKTSPRKFEVNIEVESCDDDDLFAKAFPEYRDEAPSARMEEENQVENSNQNVNAPNSDDRIKVLSTQSIPLKLESILEAADKLNSSTSRADRILNIHVRNTIGYEVKTKLAIGLMERKIQQILEQWQSWQSRSFHRDEPLFYKCYICTRSYWHLSDFRTHLNSDHTDDTTVKIALEKYETHEINVIAYHKRLVVIKDIFTPGLCYRCGRDYPSHELSFRFKEKYYKQEGCPRHFTCCNDFRDHFPSCTICKVRDKLFKCDICKSRFDTNEEVNNHLVLSHSVRSDIPILTYYITCKLCTERYQCKHLHNCKAVIVDCKSLGINILECVHCLMSFSKQSLELHMKRSRKAYKCEICGLVMAYSCMKYEHMLLHTDNYMIVEKCMVCEGLNVLLDVEAAKSHWEKKHEKEMRLSEICFPKIFVPSSCIYQSLAELDLKEQESILKDQESALKDQESALKGQEPVSDVQKSVLEGQKSEEGSLQKIGEESVLACQQSSLHEDLDLGRDFIMENFVVKEEPVDSEYSEGPEDLEGPEDYRRLAIKEEPLDDDDNQMFAEKNQAENLKEEITVKQEVIEDEEDEIDEYEDDLIKLNFNLEDFAVKKEVDDENESQNSQNNEEISDEASQDSLLEPEVIIRRDNRKYRKIYRCTTCGFEAKHKEYKEHIEYDCGKNPVVHKNYKCTKCNNTFNSMKKFLHHFEEHGYPRTTCPDCLKPFKNFTFLGQHIQSHVKQNFVRVKMITYAGDAMTKPDYQCKKCGKTVDCSDFFEHWASHINAQPSHPVKVMSRPKSTENHGQLHETIIKECIALLNKHPKECNHCHRTFKRVNECKRHIIEHLLVDAYNQKQIYKELKCQICDSGFSFSDKYKQHMRDHASLPVYKCELCDRTFSDSSNFTKHKKVHNLRVIICDLCGKKFQSKVSLEKHIEKHRNTSPITCDICNKIFYFETSYRRHVRYYHEKVTTEFRCVICGNRYPTIKQKWDHMWEVHKERKQKADCPICHKSFRKYSDVRAHAKSEHLKTITILSVKNARPQTASKREVPVSSVPTEIFVGQETETLVIYDSD